MKLLALIKKEFHRFFHDPRLIATMLLPGVIIFLLYSVIGTVIGSMTESDVRYDYKVYLVGESQAVAAIEGAVKSANCTVEWLKTEDRNRAREEVETGKATALLVFSENFDRVSGGEVRIVYDGMDSAGDAFGSLAVSVLQSYGMRFALIGENLASEEEIGMTVMQGVLPFIIVCFIFSACMSVTLESVAGEKERGTLATILVTSARRTDIALGKVLPLSAVSMLGALSSFLGVALSMPKLIGGSFGFLGSYSAGSYILLLLLLLSVVPMIVALIALLSTLSRSVKEASAYTSVLMILTMVLSLVTAFMSDFGSWTVVVPLLNAVVFMQQLLAGSMPVWQSLVSVGLNLFYTAILIFIIARLFSSEKVMYGK